MSRDPFAWSRNHPHPDGPWHEDTEHIIEDDDIFEGDFIEEMPRHYRLPLTLKQRIEADGRTVEQLIEDGLTKGTNE
jgi:hypothetical protein